MRVAVAGKRTERTDEPNQPDRPLRIFDLRCHAAC